MPQTYPCATTAPAAQPWAQLCVLWWGKGIHMYNSWHDKAMKKSVRAFDCLFTHKEVGPQSQEPIQMWLQEGPPQPVAEGCAAPIYCKADLRFEIQAPDPIKMLKPSFIPHTFPGRWGTRRGGWQLTTKCFAQQQQSWSLSSRSGTCRFHNTQHLSLWERTWRISFHGHIEYVFCLNRSALQPF